MIKIIKETKFLGISILMLCGMLLCYSAMAFVLEYTQKDFWTHQFVGLLAWGISIALIVFYYAIFFLYRRTSNFIQDEWEYQLPEVKKVINRLVGLLYFLLVMAVALYLYLAKEPRYFSLVELVLAFSLFVGLVTLGEIRSKAKHRLPYEKEQLINSSAFIFFMISVYYAWKLDIDILTIRSPFFGIFASILMNIALYNRVKKGQFFE